MSAVSRDEVAMMLVEEARRAPRDTLVVAEVATFTAPGDT